MFNPEKMYLDQSLDELSGKVYGDIVEMWGNDWMVSAILVPEKLVELQLIT